MPYNIVELFGNSCSPTLAVNLTYNLSEELTRGKHLICLAGFGAGLSWSSMLMEMGNLDFCETIDYK
jgi:3-oxoacyl-[acyl-carrier-protein] synthase-3